MKNLSSGFLLKLGKENIQKLRLLEIDPRVAFKAGEWDRFSADEKESLEKLGEFLKLLRKFKDDYQEQSLADFFTAEEIKLFSALEAEFNLSDLEREKVQYLHELKGIQDDLDSINEMFGHLMKGKSMETIKTELSAALKKRVSIIKERIRIQLEKQ